MDAADIVVENDAFRLVIGGDAAAKSLVVKATSEECIDSREGIPMFTATQERPFNNEIKLAHPNKRTTYRANRVRREGDLLVVGFAVAPYEALVRVKTGVGFVLFELEGFRTDAKGGKQYGVECCCCALRRLCGIMSANYAEIIGALHLPT